MHLDETRENAPKISKIRRHCGLHNIVVLLLSKLAVEPAKKDDRKSHKHVLFAGKLSRY